MTKLGLAAEGQRIVTSGRLLAGWRTTGLSRVMAEESQARVRDCPPVRAQHMQLRDEPR